MRKGLVKDKPPNTSKSEDDGRPGSRLKTSVTRAQEMEPGHQYVNPGEDDQMEIIGYKSHRCKKAATYLAYILTLGLLRLLFHWLRKLMLYSSHVVCSLPEAEKVLLKDQYGQYFVSTVETMTREGTGVKLRKPKKRLFIKKTDTINYDPQNDESLIRYFLCKKVKYIWDPERFQFIPLRGLDEGYRLSYFHNTKGLSTKDQGKRRVLYGMNSIAVHVTPILVLLFQQLLSPFYIFQLFSMTIWYIDGYRVYASCIFVMTSLSISVTIYQSRKFERALRNTITSSTVTTVCRGEGVYMDIPSEDLVPGDVIEIPRHGCDMQCDAVLITGNCIVNESMLTGESVPVTKTPLANPTGLKDEHDPELTLKNHSRHILFCGTHVIQTRFYGNQKVRAVVLRTGFSTSKGELVRSILFPKPVNFKFERHSYYFILVLACLAGLGFIYTVILMVRNGDNAGHIIIRSLDLITIAVPPALPAALAVGVVFSQSRLKKQNIYCISPQGISISGTINTCCFDKTGTLTEDGLDMHGVVRVERSKFEPIIKDMDDLTQDALMTCMATCHSLTIIDGVMVGDPLDLIMFNATKWVLEEPGPDETRFDMMTPTVVRPKNTSFSNGQAIDDALSGGDVGIVRQFPFSSSLQRMSVITRSLGASNFDLFVKGSPEMMVSLSRPETVPFDFQQVLQSYTQHGYRVIALAWKPLPAKLNYVKVQRVNSKSYMLECKNSAEEQAEQASGLQTKSTFTDCFQEVFKKKRFGCLLLSITLFSFAEFFCAAWVINKTRDLLETDLIFLGLLVMENRLKPQSAPVISQLIDANIRTIMVTGDNMLTALSVARECQMVDKTDRIIIVQAYPPQSGQTDVTLEFIYAEDSYAKVEEVFAMENQKIQIDEESQRFHFALTGKTWAVIRQHCPDMLNRIVVRGAVFARMAPEQKGQLVEVLQDVGYYVGMCGDGANDCGALKTAHMGISLSETEASVASPFTSKIPTIECVPKVIKEGRAALVTSFGVFKYMACYSLTQFTSVLILYWLGANVTDVEFLYMDLVLITTFSVTFSRTAPYDELVKQRPLVSLISPGPILSIITQMMLVIAAQTFMFFNVKEQPWFVPYKENPEGNYQCHENTAVFLISAYQVIILAIVFSKGAPFRKSIFSNWMFLVNIVVGLAMNIWITMYPTDPIANLIGLDVFPSLKYRALFLGVAFINFILAYTTEKFIIDNEVIRGKIGSYLKRCWPSQDQAYHKIESEIEKDHSWPPVSDKKMDLAEVFQRLDNYQTTTDADKDKTKLEDVLDSDNEESSLVDTAKEDLKIVRETSFGGEISQAASETETLLKVSNQDNSTYADDDDRNEVIV